MVGKVSVKVDKPSKNNNVVKSNNLIQARMDMGRNEQKLFATLVSMVTPQDEDFKEYIFEVKALAELMDIEDTGSVYPSLYKSAKKMMSRVVEIDTNKAYILVALLSSCVMEKGSGKIKLRFDPNLKPYLLKINGTETPYTKYELQNILKLKSAYAIRIYELLKQYSSMKDKSRTFEIEELKELLGLKGKYESFGNFDRKVIKVAIAEINEHTDIWVNYEKIKNGVEIIKLEFNFEPKFGTVNVDEENIKFYKKNGDTRYAFLDDIRQKNGYDPKLINETQLLELYDLAVEKTVLPMGNLDTYEYMKVHYDYSVEKNPKNFYSYLKSCISKDFNSIRAKMMDEMLTGIKKY